MKLRSVRQLENLKGKRVLIRVDFNVAVKNGRVPKEEMVRITAALPTINLLQKKGARLVLVTHLGRPEGKRVSAYSTKPLAAALAKAIGKPVAFSADAVGAQAERLMLDLKNGEILMLENIRFYPEEEKNNSAFAKSLSRLADYYVNDAFAVSHRAHASVVGITRWLPSCAGLLMESEINHLSKLLAHPKRPYVVVMGGAKISTKMPVLKNLFPLADHILLGGGLATTVWKALGYGVGASLVEEKGIVDAKRIARNPKIVLPVDAVVSDATGRHLSTVLIPKTPHVLCGKNDAIVDIGPKTVKAFSCFINQAMTIVWNGPVGKADVPESARGTQQIARSIAKRSAGRAFGVVGGGDTITHLGKILGTKQIDFISTGGGAMLEYLSGKTLPGIKPLYAHSR